MDKLRNIGIIITRVAILLILILSITFALFTYAVVPEKYEKDVYSKQEVNEIALIEKGKGIRFAYRINERNLFFVFIPLLILFVIHVLLIQSREKSHTKYR